MAKLILNPTAPRWDGSGIVWILTTVMKDAQDPSKPSLASFDNTESGAEYYIAIPNGGMVWMTVRASSWIEALWGGARPLFTPRPQFADWLKCDGDAWRDARGPSWNTVVLLPEPKPDTFVLRLF